MGESSIQTNKPLERATDEPTELPAEAIRVDVANADGVSISPQLIRRLVRTILTANSWTGGEISVAIVDGPTMQALNRQYLNHDYPTDVLAFPLQTHPRRRWISGEVIVCAEIARQSAIEYGIDPTHELALYVVHGTLHLAGLNDKTPGERRKMREAELHFMTQFGLAYCSPDESNQVKGCG